MCLLFTLHCPTIPPLNAGELLLSRFKLRVSYDSVPASLQHVFASGVDRGYRGVSVWSASAIYLAEMAALQWQSGSGASLLRARCVD